MLDKQDLKYKEYLALRKAYDKLDNQLRKLPLVELREPYQKGWLIEYDLRDDIKRRSDYFIIKEVLSKAFYPRYTTNVKVVRAIRKKQDVLIKSRWSVSHISSYYPETYYVGRSEFSKLNAEVAKYFILDTWSQDYKQRGYKRYYVQLPKYWMVLKVKPNIITHKRSKGGPMEKEFMEISNRLWGSSEFASFRTNYGKSYPASKDRSRVRDDLNKFKNGQIEDVYNHKIKMEYEY